MFSYSRYGSSPICINYFQYEIKRQTAFFFRSQSDYAKNTCFNSTLSICSVLSSSKVYYNTRQCTYSSTYQFAVTALVSLRHTHTHTHIYHTGK